MGEVDLFEQSVFISIYLITRSIDDVVRRLFFFVVSFLFINHFLWRQSATSSKNFHLRLFNILRTKTRLRDTYSLYTHIQKIWCAEWCKRGESFYKIYRTCVRVAVILRICLFSSVSSLFRLRLLRLYSRFFSSPFHPVQYVNVLIFYTKYCFPNGIVRFGQVTHSFMYVESR